MMTKGKVNNPDAELRTAYARHDTAGIVDFLARHKDKPGYSELYGQVTRNTLPADNTNINVEYLLSEKGQEVLYDNIKRFLEEFGNRKYKISDNGLKNRITFIKEHNPLEMIDAVCWLERARKIGKLDLIVLEPKEYFEGYIRENLQNIGSMRLEKTGHDLMVLSYANKKEVPIFCLGLNTLKSDIETIYRETISQSYKNMSSIVNESDKEIILKELSKQGLPVH